MYQKFFILFFLTEKCITIMKDQLLKILKLLKFFSVHVVHKGMLANQGHLAGRTKDPTGFSVYWVCHP